MKIYPGYLTAELKDIIISVGALTASFSILLTRFSGGRFGGNLFIIIGVSFGTVITAFLFHELAHRYVARRYGGIAFFKMWPPGIILVLVTSLFGFIFAAPGAVNIGGIFRKDQIGKTSLAGPGTNLSIGAAFYIFTLATAGMPGTGLIRSITLWVAVINLWFALFNMIPIPPFDGEKIFSWNRRIYVVVALIALVMNLIDGFFFVL